MPCTLTGSREGDLEFYLSQTREEVTKVAQLLCKSCALLDREGVSMPKDLKKWWKKHQELDAERKMQEKREKKHTKKKSSPKLTKKVR